MLTYTSVTSYSVATGCLSMGHLYPPDTNVVALVDVNLLLATLTTELTRVGEYVNVIGYITARRDSPGTDIHAINKESARVSVQALVVWSTGPMDIQKYERTFHNTK